MFQRFKKLGKIFLCIHFIFIPTIYHTWRALKRRLGTNTRLITLWDQHASTALVQSLLHGRNVKHSDD